MKWSLNHILILAMLLGNWACREHHPKAPHAGLNADALYLQALLATMVKRIEILEAMEKQPDMDTLLQKAKLLRQEQARSQKLELDWLYHLILKNQLQHKLPSSSLEPSQEFGALTKWSNKGPLL